MVYRRKFPVFPLLVLVLGLAVAVTLVKYKTGTKVSAAGTTITNWKDLLLHWPVTNPDSIEFYRDKDTGEMAQVLIKGNQWYYRSNPSVVKWAQGTNFSEGAVTGLKNILPPDKTMDSFSMFYQTDNGVINLYQTVSKGSSWWSHLNGQPWKWTGTLFRDKDNNPEKIGGGCTIPLPKELYVDTMTTFPYVYNGKTTTGVTVTQGNKFWTKVDSGSDTYVFCGYPIAGYTSSFTGHTAFQLSPNGPTSEIFTNGSTYWFFPDVNIRDSFISGTIPASDANYFYPTSEISRVTAYPNSPANTISSNIFGAGLVWHPPLAPDPTKISNFMNKTGLTLNGSTSLGVSQLRFPGGCGGDAYNPFSVTVYAWGTPGEVNNPAVMNKYPHVHLLINDLQVHEFNVTGTNQPYTYTSTQPITSTQIIKVVFTNDYWSPVEDRNLVVDKIVVNGTDYQSESSSTWSTGTYSNGNCNPGYKLSEWLACGGYFQYNLTSLNPNPLYLDNFIYILSKTGAKPLYTFNLEGEGLSPYHANLNCHDKQDYPGELSQASAIVDYFTGNWQSLSSVGAAAETGNEPWAPNNPVNHPNWWETWSKDGSEYAKVITGLPPKVKLPNLIAGTGGNPDWENSVKVTMGYLPTDRVSYYQLHTYDFTNFALTQVNSTAKAIDDIRSRGYEPAITEYNLLCWTVGGGGAVNPSSGGLGQAIYLAQHLVLFAQKNIQYADYWHLFDSKDDTYKPYGYGPWKCGLIKEDNTTGAYNLTPAGMAFQLLSFLKNNYKVVASSYSGGTITTLSALSPAGKTATIFINPSPITVNTRYVISSASSISANVTSLLPTAACNWTNDSSIQYSCLTPPGSSYISGPTNISSSNNTLNLSLKPFSVTVLKVN